MADGFDPVEASVVEAREAVVAGEVTARRLASWYLDRIAAHDDRLNAVVRTNPSALDRAADLDAGLAADGPAGPLHGVPVLLKDNVDVAGLPTTAGSPVLDGPPATGDAAVVRRLRGAGAVVLGKANMHEFALGAGGPSAVGGVARNPYDRSRTPGGSSTGPAAAVAANLAAVAVGTDTGGSVRIPAAWSNLVGVRPTVGVVSRDGVVPLALSQDTAGPIARTVADAALLLDVLSGFDPADPATARADRRTPGSYLARAREGDLDGARIGLLDGALPAEGRGAAVADRTATAVEDLAAAGATVVEGVTVEGADPETLAGSVSVVDHEFRRDLDDYLAARPAEGRPGTLAAVLASGEHGDPVADDLERACSHDPATLDADPDYLGRLREAAALRDRVLAALAGQDLDALAYPTATVPPVGVEETVPKSALWTYLASCADCPAVSVPAGFAGGLPVGLELLGRPFEEARLLELAAGYERATGHRRPPEGFDGRYCSDWG